ncbi:NAD(+)--arginine ADP-ribosyltransferase EFV [Streptococcus parauberis]|uniref:NAD(+)--arginine ADP-ribosyltransferase EFV n=2 Tax=Streptococcus parauberis TaxID=1348 RepID=A0A854WBA3_9STRE|nr:NAD(+)--arginine ADP-ribosyltransferase EFV [Streptococcus parauberis]PCH14144.1 NAD(+)--arginine ADP-ribosyltransferase EFV [Streptococcus parauberis]
MTALLEQLDISANNLRKSLGSTINSHLLNTGQLAYNELFYEFESGHGGINFAMLRDEELKTIIETPVANFKLSERINDGVVPDLKRNIKNELTRLFLMGESMPKVSSRLSELGYSSYRRAMTITRTEAGRVQAITRQKAQIEAETLDIQFEKQWVATLDTRTRHNHANLDGVRVNPDGYFTINGHRTKQPHMFGLASEDVNCRCRTISVLLDDDEPMLRRDNETGEVVEYKNYRDWEKHRKKMEEKAKYQRKKDIESAIIGLKTSDNIQIKSITNHLLERMTEREVLKNDVISALNEPLRITKDKIKENGISRKYIGKEASVVVNPETGSVVTTHKTSRKIVRKYLGGKIK